MRGWVLVAIAVSVVGAAGGCATRGVQGARLRGAVTDEAGQPVGGANVIAVEAVSGQVWEARVNGGGYYRLGPLPAGRYQLVARSRDARVSLPSLVQLADGDTLTLALAVSGTNPSVLPAPPPAPPPPPMVLGGALRYMGASGATVQPIRVGGAVYGVEGGVAGGVVGGVVGGLGAAPPFDDSLRCVGPMNTEAYDRIDEGGFLDPRRHALSTFSVDVDTASYANVRRFLNEGRLPPKDAVRIEELVNYFVYDYAPPTDGAPFAVHSEVGPCPWNAAHRLVRLALQGRVFPETDLPARNLVFLLDVSGSMNEPRKLPLVKAALRLLVERLRAQDHVAIVVYAGASGLVLPRTPGHQRHTILQAIERLQAGGSTNGGQGIELAYALAQEGFVKGAANRLILATDGDFNVGTTDLGALTRLIEEKRQGGVFLSVLGFGSGNLKDATMERLADVGNGNYSYIDTLQEARKVLVREAGGTLVTIAKDVKLQVEWNPRRVGAYRLIGYENRRLRDEDFNDDRKDAGEIGAGHRVTAFYEIAAPDAAVETGGVDPLTYQRPGALAPEAASDELLRLKLRHKDPAGDESQLLTHVVREPQGACASPSADFGFAAAVVELGLLLRGSEHAGQASYAQTLELLRRYRGDDPEGDRGELLRLAALAETLAAPARAAAARDE